MFQYQGFCYSTIQNAVNAYYANNCPSFDTSGHYTSCIVSGSRIISITYGHKNNGDFRSLTSWQITDLSDYFQDCGLQLETYTEIFPLALLVFVIAFSYSILRKTTNR